MTTTELLTAKLIFNSTISTPGARFGGYGIKYFYLNSYMENPDYMWVMIIYLPDKVMDAYNPHSKVQKD